MKSTDYELKFEKAKEYYQEKDYIKATQLFDELLTIYKGSSKAEEVNYYYAECYYGNRDFILAKGEDPNTDKENYGISIIYKPTWLPYPVLSCDFEDKDDNNTFVHYNII